MKINQEYKTILVLVIGFTIISFIFKLKVLFYFSIGVLFISIISNRSAKNISKLWMGIGKYIGAINSKIILSIFFVFILIPLSYLKKIFGPRPKQKKNTNWVRVKEDETINFNDPW